MPSTKTDVSTSQFNLLDAWEQFSVGVGPQHNLEVSAMVLVVVSASLVSLPLSPSIGGCAPFICLATLLARSFFSASLWFFID